MKLPAVNLRWNVRKMLITQFFIRKGLPQAKNKFVLRKAKLKLVAT